MWPSLCKGILKKSRIHDTIRMLDQPSAFSNTNVPPPLLIQLNKATYKISLKNTIISNNSLAVYPNRYTFLCSMIIIFFQFAT